MFKNVSSHDHHQHFRVIFLIVLAFLGCLLLFAHPLGASEVVAIGDLHGDYPMFLQLLNYLNFTRDETSGWIDTGSVELVQTGDVLDRGEFGLEIIKLFMNNTNNSKVDMLIGNHEELNLLGAFHYVNINEYSEEYKSAMVDKNSVIRRFLLTRKVVRIIDGVVYVHAGILPSFIEKDDSFTNKEPSEIVQLLNEKISNLLDHLTPIHVRSSNSLLGHRGPLWLRDYSEGRNCESLYRVLEILGAKHMVVGHEIQTDISVRCYNPKKQMSVICIDIGMSHGYGGANPSAIKIVDGKTLYVFENLPTIRMVDLASNTVVHLDSNEFSSPISIGNLSVFISTLLIMLLALFCCRSEPVIEKEGIRIEFNLRDIELVSQRKQ